MSEFAPAADLESLRNLPDAIEHFLQEFAVVEDRSVPIAMRALTDDQRFIDQAQRRLDLPARLTLLKRMAMVREADSSSIALIEGVIKKTSQLQEKRASLSRSSAADTSEIRWVPTPTEVHECERETLAVQRTLTCVAERLRDRDGA